MPIDSDAKEAMRKILATLIAASAVLPSSVWAFNAGDAVTTDALIKAEAVQGEAPKTWEPGKVYILECWATWCGPCVAVIPHVDGLYDKYKDKGLRVVGVNVWEDGKDKVAEFVKKKGDGMSYPVLYTGKSGTPFETEYLKPDGVTGIPHAFIVKDGKFLFSGHPAGLTEEVIEGLLAGGEAQEKIVKERAEAGKKAAEEKKKMAAAKPLIMEFQKASAAKDVDTMAAKLAEVEKLDPTLSMIPSMRLNLTIARKDWPALDKSLQELKEGPQAIRTVMQTALALDDEEVPEATRKVILAKLQGLPATQVGEGLGIVISRYQWMSGDKEGAKASAKKVISSADKDTPTEPLAAYAKSLDDGTPQTAKQVFAAMNAAVRKQKSGE